MNKPRYIAPATKPGKTEDRAFVLAVLRSISRNMKQIDEVIVTAGIGLDRGLISPGAAINMVNSVAPGCVDHFMREVEAAEIGVMPLQEAAE